MARRAFTLVELMVASAIAFVIVAAGAALASAMARQVRETEEQGDLGARVAIVASVVQNALDGVAYGWRVEDDSDDSDGIAEGTGGPGRAACVTNTGICDAGNVVRPLSVCTSTGVNHTTCTVADTTSPDAIRAIVPRDDVSEALRIVDRNTTALTTVCDNTNVPNPVVFDVRGAHQNAWAIGDLVLVSNPGHATVGVVRAAAPAEASETLTYTISLELTGTGLVSDDGGSDVACNAADSLVGARVMRVKQVVIRLNGTTLEMSQKPTTAAAAFVPLLTDVEDFQVRLDTTYFGADASGPQYCLAEAPAINNVLYAQANVNGTAPCNRRLDRDDPAAGAGDDHIIRVAGLHVAALLRSSAQTTNFTRPITYLFDRAPPGTSDQRRRRPVYFYVGMTNAAQY